MSQKILVTGAGGFVGRSLVRRLLSDGCSVVANVRSEKPASFFAEDTSNLTVIQADLVEGVAPFSDIELDAIIHLAAQQPLGSHLTYEDYYAGNVLTTRSVIELAKQKQVKFVGYASSTNILGAGASVIDENAAVIPVNHYGLTKYAAERLLDIELGGSDIKTAVMRYSTVIGPEAQAGLIHTYCELARNNENIDVFNNGERKRSLLHVDDAVDVMVSALTQSDKLNGFDVFTIGSKDSAKMIDIAGWVVEFMNSDSKVIPVDKALSVQRDAVLNISKAETMLGYSPMTVEEGLRACIKEIMHEI